MYEIIETKARIFLIMEYACGGELFDYIVRYVPQKIDLDYKLKPFIPDFIPAVGDIDAFIKVESNNPLELGLTVLDEPSAKQSDPNIMELQLRF